MPSPLSLPRDLASARRASNPSMSARAQSLVHVGGEVAAVVGEGERRLVGEGVGRDQVLPPERKGVEAERAAQFPRRLGLHPLDDVVGFGPAGAAVGRRRLGVGLNRPDMHMGRRDVVDPGEQAGGAEHRKEVPDRRHVGPHVGQRP